MKKRQSVLKQHLLKNHSAGRIKMIRREESLELIV